MHIPDGLIAPQAYLAATALAVPCWVYAVKRVSTELDERTIPRLAVLTALAFVLSTVMLPLPGGTSAHFSGVGLLVLAFGFWPAFVAYSLVLALQALLLGAGGITALPINALTMGLAGGAVVAGMRALYSANPPGWVIVGSVWLGVVVAACLLALILGIQPYLARDDAGNPLFFPFGPAVTLPVIVLPHLVIGALEGVLTWLVLAHPASRPLSNDLSRARASRPTRPLAGPVASFRNAAGLDRPVRFGRKVGAKDRAVLTGWLAAVVAITFVHDPWLLAALVVVVLAALGRAAPRIALRAAAAVALVNLTVSAAYVVSAWIAGGEWIAFVARLNLRVFLLAMLAFWMIRSVDLARAATPWPRLKFLVVLAIGQIRSLAQLLSDYRMAFASRSPTRPPLRVQFGSAGRQAAALMEKGERQAERLNQGMRARGFFDGDA